MVLWIIFKPFRPICLSSNCHHYGLLLNLLLLVAVIFIIIIIIIIIVIIIIIMNYYYYYYSHSDSGSRWWRLCCVCTAFLDVEGLLGMLKKYQSNDIWGLNCYLVFFHLRFNDYFVFLLFYFHHQIDHFSSILNYWIVLDFHLV